MIYAIISDLHANLAALEAVLDDSVRHQAEKIVCLGDIVGYGPQPRETLELIRKTAATVIAGNHDDAVCGRVDESNFIELAGEAVRRHRQALSSDDIAWLRALPHTARLGNAAFAHGDLTNPPAFNYVNSRADAAANFKATDAQILFVGHTHVPLLHVVGHSGEVYRVIPQDFSAEVGKRYIVNVGSVGYPRESQGQCYSSYVLYDDATGSVQFRQLPFSVASLLQRGSDRPYGRMWKFLLPTALAMLFGVVIAFFSFKPGVPRPVPPASAESAQPVLRKKRLFFASTKAKVHANLKLAKDSAPAHLTISFQDRHGNLVSEIHETVRQSSTRGFVSAKDSASATLTIQAAAPENPPDIRAFNPSVSSD